MGSMQSASPPMFERASRAEDFRAWYRRVYHADLRMIPYAQWGELFAHWQEAVCEACGTTKCGCRVCGAPCFAVCSHEGGVRVCARCGSIEGVAPWRVILICSVCRPLMEEWATTHEYGIRMILGRRMHRGGTGYYS
jgi:hypothetical protein